MKRESGQTDNPDDNSTWAQLGPESATQGTPSPMAQGEGVTIPVPSTGDAEETVARPNRGSADDSGEATPISSFAGVTGQEQTRDWDALPPPIFEPGQIVFGKYKLDKMLGEGGMGQVWLVENIQLDCKSALKLIRPEIAKSDKAWKRFKREAQVMAKLNHPNAVAVRDFARAQSVAYIEMEYVRGQSLDKVIEEREGKPFPVESVAPVVDQICSVLQEAHDHVDEKSGKPRPIIHRDLKPSNLMLAERKPPGQNLKVLDFGIAKMADDDRESNLTGDAEFIGTAAYSSPEQIRSESIDGRSDLYSLGVILYQFLTGDLPFQGGPRRALVAHLMETPRPFHETNPAAAVPPAIEALVLQCLEKNPDQRPRSARELNERFQAALRDGTDVHAPKMKPAKSVAGPLAAAAIVAVAVIGGAFIVARGRSTDVVPKKPDITAVDSKNAGPSTTETNDIPPVVLPPKSSWKLPEGFRRIGEDAPEGPKSIERIAGRILFDRQDSGAYLPRGFVVVDQEQKSGDLPLCLSRGTDLSLARFRRIKGGRFQMGNVQPKPDAEPPGLDLQDQPILPHWVELSAFYIQETEVTNGQIEAFLKERPGVLKEDKLENWRRYKDLIPTRDNMANSVVNRYPAVCIDWETAKTYAQAIGGLLPTEAQWEYVARSEGHPNRFAIKGFLGRNAKPQANLFLGEEVDQMPVRSKEKDVTDQLVYDMTGNVREWCRDGYEPDSKTIGRSTEIHSALVDPCVTVSLTSETFASSLRVGTGQVNDSDYAEGAKYVVRGGSFQTEPDFATSFQRDADFGKESLKDLGFRVVIELPILVAAP